MKFSKLVSVFEKLEKASSHKKMEEILGSFFRSCSAAELVDCSYLLVGRVNATTKSSDLGIAKKFIQQALASAFEKTANPKKVRELQKKLGDLGLVAAKLNTKKSSSLSIHDVIKALQSITKMQGEGSQDKKIKALAKIISKASSIEAKYICRITLGTMRIGANELRVLDGLALAFNKGDRVPLERAFNLSSDIGAVAKAAKARKLKTGGPAPAATKGKPIRSMLAQRVENIEDIQKRIPGLIAAEDKLDGERIQAHKEGDNITLFSRRLENITLQYPDVVEAIRKGIKARHCILDGEAVPIDKEGNLLPFQLIMQRRRKHDIDEYVKKVPVKYFLFDLLSLNGKDIMGESYPKRAKKLRSTIRSGVDGIGPVTKVESKNLADIEKFFKDSLARGTEGIVCKSTGKDSVYRAGARAWVWIKWKKEYCEDLCDSFDLVVVGSYAGEGKRVDAFGALLCACYNPEDDRFETVCKVGSGFTDKDLVKFTKDLKEFKRGKAPRNVMIRDVMMPDIFFEPRMVIEVRGGDITKSPVHTCAIGQKPLSDTEGLALRFPRMIRVRPDKSAKQSTTSDEVLCMFRDIKKKKK